MFWGEKAANLAGTRQHSLVAGPPQLHHGSFSQSDNSNFTLNSEPVTEISLINDGSAPQKREGALRMVSKPRLSFRTLGVHLSLGFMVLLHVFFLVASIRGLKIAIPVEKMSTIQTIVSAVLQTFFTIALGIILSLSHGIAVDAYIRHPPPLGILHLRMEAWSGLWASLTSLFLRSRGPNPQTSGQSRGIGRIFLYFLAAAVLQISSSSIYALTFDRTGSFQTVSSVKWKNVFLGSRLGNYDALWPSRLNVTSLNRVFIPDVWQNVRSNMYPIKVNDTRYPGLQGRIIHNTINLDNMVPKYVAFSEARVDATEMNIHCSQVTDATVDVFTLPRGSSDFSAGNFADVNGVINQNFSADVSVWIDFKMEPPPYWNRNIPGLNFTGKWDEFIVIQNGLSTRVMFQPWAWEGHKESMPGHQQVVMVIAAAHPEVLLKDTSGILGKVHNFTITPAQPCTSFCPTPLRGYIQVIGCTSRADNLTATISREGLLLDPPTDLKTSAFPNPSHDHLWDDFVWEDQNRNLPIDRQLLFAFTPTSSYNVTNVAAPSRYKDAAINGNVENLIAAALSGETVNTFNQEKMNLPEFQGFLEHLFASYLWNLNRLCTPLDSIYGCGMYFRDLYAPAEFILKFPSVVMEVVLWRAILSMFCSTLMCLLALIILGIRSDRPTDTPLRNGGFLDVAKLMRDSSIPDVVSVQPVKINSTGLELANSLIDRKLRYGPSDDLDGYNLDVLDRSRHTNSGP
ncbi:hypothetical protein BDZ94DRAFT_1314868 [Collybia nuda]|uniref:Uncharacterized protein n=1 Tax=Collybia nuda TaxID=64659 RepID=A0A9P6C948_9AGAR|nr:hypothetical protein BDZ94DRAFT_1314868 [Collybia nuda]